MRQCNSAATCYIADRGHSVALCSDLGLQSLHSCTSSCLQSRVFTMFYVFVVAFFVANCAYCPIVEGDQMFSGAICQSDQLVCATSSANRSCSVRSKVQCAYECQHGGETTCVGVNYRQSSNTCEIYYQCPTNFTTNIVACQFIQV